MTCEQFDRWLYTGAPAEDHAVFAAHAAGCARCAAMWRAERELATLLATDPDPPDVPARVVASTAAFADAVMARVQETPQVIEPVAALVLLPWCVRAAAEPAAAAAMVLAGLLVWRPDAIGAIARALLARTSAWLASWPALSWPGSAGVAMEVALVTCAALGAWALFLLGERLTRPHLRAAR